MNVQKSRVMSVQRSLLIDRYIHDRAKNIILILFLLLKHIFSKDSTTTTTNSK
jgi:hypothetical protein